MTVTDGMYLIKNYNFLHPLVPDPTQAKNTATIEPFRGPYEIKEEALWRIGVSKDDLKDRVKDGFGDGSVSITSVYHSTFRLSASSANEPLSVKECDEEGPFPRWKILLLDSHYYALEPVGSGARLRITGEVGRVVLKQLAQDCEDPIAQEWDIQVVKESYFAFRNRRLGQYLSTGKEISNDSAPVSLDDKGIPRKFIWEVSFIEGHYSLRNLEVDHYLQIQLAPKPLVSVQGDASDKLSQWTFNRDVTQTVSMVNCHMSSLWSKNAILEAEKKEQHKYSIILNPKDSLSNLPKQALWELELIGPNEDFVEPPITPALNNLLLSPPLGSSQAKLLLIQEAVKKTEDIRATVRALIDRNLGAKKVSEAKNIIHLFNKWIQDAQFPKSSERLQVYASVGAVTDGLEFTVPNPLYATLGALVAQSLEKEAFVSFHGQFSKKIKDDLALNLELLRQKNPDKLRSLVEIEGKARGKERMEIMQAILNDVYSEVFTQKGSELVDTNSLGIADAILSFKTKILGELDSSGIQQLVQQGVQAAQGIQQLKENVVGREKDTQKLFAPFNECMAFATTKLDAIFTNFEAANKTINDLDEAIKKNSQQIRLGAPENSALVRQNVQRLNFIEGFVNGDMNPKELINTLGSGLFKDLPQDELNKLRETANLKTSLVQDIGAYASGVTNFVETFNRVNIAFGEKIKIPDEITKGVALGSQLINLGLSFAPPTNYLGAVSAVAGLLGLGGGNKRDVAGERHAQIMDKLGQLAHGQEVIIDGQARLLKASEYLAENTGRILENQEAMFKKLIIIEQKIDEVIQGQKKIIEILSEIDKKIELHYKTIMIEFAKLAHEIAIGRFNMYYGLNKPVIDLYQEVEKLVKFPNFDPNTNHFRDYASLTQFFSGQTKRNLTIGLPSLKNALYISPDDEAGASVFYLNNFSSQATWIPKYCAYYQALWETVSDLSPGIDFAFFSGLYPSKSIDQLENKLKRKEEDPEQLLPKRFYKRFYGPFELGNPTASVLLKNPYFFNKVRDCVTFAIRFHSLLDMCDENTYELLPLGQLANQGRIFADEQIPTSGQELLDYALLRLETLLVQQTLRGGDCFLPAFYDIWLREKPDPKFEALNSLFKQDALLAYNFFLYAFRKEVTERDPDYTRFLWARNSKGVDRDLKALTQIGWDYQYVANKGWEVHFAEHVFPLPSTIELKEGILRQVEGMETIFALRQRIFQELLGYKTANLLADAETRKVYMTALYATG